MKRKVNAVAKPPFSERFGEMDGVDTGAIDAAIADIQDSVETIYRNILPKIARLDAQARDELLEQIIDLEMEFAHFASTPKMP